MDSVFKVDNFRIKTIKTKRQYYFLFDEYPISLGEKKNKGIIPIREDAKNRYAKLSDVVRLLLDQLF